MDNIADRIKFLRKDHLMTQMEFAKRLGVTNAHISKIEKGGTVPSDSLIKLICKTFYVNEFWIKNGEDPIYIEFEAEEKMTKALETISKMLNSENENIRFLVAEAEAQFSKMINVIDSDDSQKSIYLRSIIKGLSIINKYNDIIKKNLESGQIILEEAYNKNFEDYIEEMETYIKETKEELKKYLI